MTEPSTKPTQLATPKPSDRAVSVVRPVLVTVFRLLLLSVGSALALGVGIAIAQVAPGVGEDRPLLEGVLRGIARLRGAPNPEAELPQTQRSDRAGVGGGEPQLNGSDQPDTVSLPELPEADARANSPNPNSADSRSVPEARTEVTPQSQQALQQQVERLRLERQDLEEAIAQMEAQVGIPPSSAPLEVRLAALEQRLEENSAQPSESASERAPQSSPQPSPQSSQPSQPSPQGAPQPASQN